MIPIHSTTMQGIKAEAIAISKQNPKMYVLIHNTFGLYASLEKRLHVHAPGDIATLQGIDWYAINGKIKKFTNRQQIADTNATPMMR